MVHSAATLVRPRSSNLRVPCCSLMIPKTGSASCFLRLLRWPTTRGDGTWASAFLGTLDTPASEEGFRSAA